MLDLIRANAQSWGVKIAFGLIIIVFVFWGVGNFRSSGNTTLVKVNGTPITAQDVAVRLSSQVEAIRQGNQGLTQEDIQRFLPQLKQEVFRQLLMETLLEQEADRVGVVATPQELKQVIATFPSFHNDKGVFDQAVYERALQNQKQTPGAFEAGIRRELLLTKFQRMTAEPAFVPVQEARNLFLYQSEQRVLDAILFKTSEFMDQSIPGDADISAYYNANTGAFQIPPQADVSYVAVNSEILAAQESVTLEEIEAYYEKNRESYARPERVRARHILVLVDREAPQEKDAEAKAKIDEAAEQIREGKDFAEVAIAISQDGSAGDGGDLGWFTRGRMVPEFEQAVFDLQPGQVSEPVRTDFGWHLVKLEEHADADVTPLTEVEDDIRHTLALDKARPKVQELLDNLLVAVINGQSLTDAAAKDSLTVEDTGLKDAQELAQDLQLKPSDIQMILDSPQGQTLETAFSTGDGYLLVHVNKTNPATTKPFDDVKQEISDQLQINTARDKARDAAETVRASMTETLSDELKERLVTVSPMGRDGFVSGFVSGNTALVDAIFKDTSFKWLPAAYLVDDGAALVRVDSIAPPLEDAWKMVEQNILGVLNKSKQEEQFYSFLDALQKAGKIESVNFELIEKI